MSTDERLDAPKKTLLVCLLGLGDVVMCTPAIRHLKRSFPDTSFGFLTREGFGGVLENNPFLDRLHGLRVGGGFFSRFLRGRKLAKELRRHAYESAVMFGNYKELTSWLRAGGIEKERMRFMRFCRDGEEASHFSRQTVDFAAELTGEAADYPAPEIFPSEKHELKARELLPEQLRDGKRGYLVAHIGNSTFRRRRFALGGSRISHRAWPLENWRLCLPLLVRELDLDVILTGSAKEGTIADQLLDGCEPDLLRRIHNVCGSTSPLVMAELIRRSRLFIGADTGPTHIAAATNTRIIVLIGPTDASISGPRPTDADLVTTLRRGVECSPCVRSVRKRCADNFCLRQISADELVETVRCLV